MVLVKECNWLSDCANLKVHSIQPRNILACGKPSIISRCFVPSARKMEKRKIFEIVQFMFHVSTLPQ